MLWPSEAVGQDHCTTPEDAFRQLEGKHQEYIIGHGVNYAGVFLQLWISKEKDTWTLLSLTRERACLISSGDNWREVPKEKRGPRT